MSFEEVIIIIVIGVGLVSTMSTVITLFQRRGTEKASAGKITKNKNLDQMNTFPEQKDALQALLEKRLNPPSALNVVGVDEHINQLRDILVSSEAPWIVSLSGIGGIGKTTLADTLLRQIVGQCLCDDFGWISARPTFFHLEGSIKSVNQPTLTVNALVEGLVQQLIGIGPTTFTAEEALAALENRLKERSHLIVIDNLETFDDIESLLPTLRRLTNPTKFLLTSRKSLFSEPDIYHFSVPPLSELNALRLVREEANIRNLPHLVRYSDNELREIYEIVGGNPLALRLIVGQTHTDHLDKVLNDLRTARGQKVENLYTYIYRRVWDNLDGTTRDVFLLMPLVVEDGDNIDYLKAATRLELDEVRDALELLITLNLVDVRRGADEWSYSIHNLTRTFLEEQVLKWK